MVKIEKMLYGKALNALDLKPVDVYRYTMTNNNNMTIAILTRGAVVQSIKYPDTYGKMADICLGYDNLQAYIDDKNVYMGAIIGRVANRVSKDKITIGFKDYVITKNYNDKYQLNGGFQNFGTMIWQSIQEMPNGLVLQHINPHCIEGYPGELTVRITYTLDDENNFGVSICAETDRRTILNISQYLFLNLAGNTAHKEGLYQHNIMLKSNRIVECDLEQIPTGNLLDVCETIFDLRRYINLGKRLKKFAKHPLKGFDQNYCIDVCGGDLTPVAKVIHPCTGRWLEFYCNQPSVNFFTCNHWPDLKPSEPVIANEENNTKSVIMGKEEKTADDQPGLKSKILLKEPIIGKNKTVYGHHDAFCLSSQAYPDAINQETFPGVLLEPGCKYCNKMVYRFGCCDLRTYSKF